jgi:hypothetical protein
MSKDGGTSWTAAERLSWNSGSSELPAIAVDVLDNLHVVWQDTTPRNGEIYYKKSTDRGKSWSASQRITWTSGSSLDPAVPADPAGHIHLCWADETYRNWEIYHKQSSDAGTTWTEKKKLSTTLGRSWRPSMVSASATHVHVVWEDDTPDTDVPEVYYTKSTDGGDNWASNRRITYTSGGSLNPDLAVDPFGDLHAVWEDWTPGSYEIYYKKSTDGGATWTSAERLTWTPDISRFADILADPSGQLHVVWRDRTPGNYEVYYRESTDGGITWEAKRRLTWTFGESYNPVIAVEASGALHVVWFDNTPGNYEIYYKKRT